MRKGFLNIGLALVGLCVGITTVASAVSGWSSDLTVLTLGEPAIPPSLGRPTVSTLLLRSGGSWELRAFQMWNDSTDLFRDSTVAGFQQLPAISINRKRVHAISADRRGQLYATDSSSKLHLMTSEGIEFYVFRVAPRPDSIAVMANGDVLIAGPSKGKLVHVYSPQGRWLRSFGDVKTFVPDNPSLNHQLNRGQVLVGSKDEIFYVFFDAPSPSFLRFSSSGELVSEHAITGEAVDAQLPVALRYIENVRGRACLGSLNIVRGATVDPVTGDLWLGFNGTSLGGNVQRYSPSGEKLDEIQLRVSDGDSLPSVVGLAAAGGELYATLADGGVYRVPLGRLTRASASGRVLGRLARWTRRVEAKVALPAVLATGCPPQNMGGCSLNCNDGSNNNCANDLYASITFGFIKFDPSCSTNYATGVCTFSTKSCNPETGTIQNHSNNPKCTCSYGGCGATGWVTNPEYCSNPNDKDYCGCCFRDQSPIFVDLGRDGFRFSSAEDGVIFDIDGTGATRRLAWPLDPAADPWLALDRNNNGEIDSLVELFGNMTPLSSGELADHGYALLDELDANRDGWVDARDPMFGRLWVWADANRNGVSEPGEIRTLAQAHVRAIATEYRESDFTDEWGNRFRFRSRVKLGAPSSGLRASWDVFVVSQPIPPES